MKFNNSKMNKIAVCLFGQYRTGDYVLPRIKKHFDIPGVEVDWFCSFKSSTNYERYQGFHDKYAPGEVIIPDCEKIKQHLINELNPKAISIVSDDCKIYDDVTVERFLTSKMLLGWIDSTMLKQRYELEHGFQYDMVFVLRYDVMIGPIDWPKAILDTFRDKPFEEVHKITNSSKEWIITTKLWNSQAFAWPPLTTAVQDLCFAGTSLAVDFMTAEMVNFVVKTNKQEPIIYDFVDGHCIYGFIADLCGVDVVSHDKIENVNMFWAVVRPDADLSLDVFSDEAFCHNVDLWFSTVTSPRSPISNSKEIDIDIKDIKKKVNLYNFTSSLSSKLTTGNSVEQITGREGWNLADDHDMILFYVCQQKSYIEYQNLTGALRDEHKEAIELFLNSDSKYFVPDWFDDYPSDNNKHMIHDMRGDVIYWDKGSDKTIVVLNNHLTWLETVYRGKHTRSHLHYYNWLSTATETKDYNFISLTEDVTRANKNPLAYPSWFMNGANDQLDSIKKISDYVKSIFPNSEYYVYSPCKNAMAGAALSSELKAKKCFVEHGITGFTYTNGLNIFNVDKNKLDLDVYYDNFYFMSDIREVYFDLKNSFKYNSLSQIINDNPNTEFLYYYTSDNKDVGYMIPYVDFIKDFKANNFSIESNKDKSPHSNQILIRKSALRFFSQ